MATPAASSALLAEQNNVGNRADFIIGSVIPITDVIPNRVEDSVRNLLFSGARLPKQHFPNQPQARSQ